MVRPKAKPQKYDDPTKRLKEISEQLKAAGAKIKQAQFSGITYVHLEGHPVTDDLLTCKQLRDEGYCYNCFCVRFTWL